MRAHHFLAAALVVSLSATRARANGRYPQANHIVFEPGDASHLVVTASFGLLESKDRGATFAWRCEAALGVMGDQDEIAAITAGKTTAVVVTNGLVTTADGCSFRKVPELAGKYVADVALSKGSPHELFVFHTDLALSGQLESEVLHSIDDGQTWQVVGSPLPSNLLPLTIDVAPSNPERVYLSARLGLADAYASVLLRSDDGGKTFASMPIPGTTDQRLAYIAAVHPTDADRLYLRVIDSPGTVIYSTIDGGKNFQKRFSGQGDLLGFALSPDGAHLAFGGPKDGIWVGAEDATMFEQRSHIGPTCLAWSGDGIYACADQASAPFSIGRSHDDAATFDTLLRYDALCGTTACPAESQDSVQCAPAWETIGPMLGASCRMDSGVGDVDASAIDTGALDANPHDGPGAVRDAADDGPPISVADSGTPVPTPPPGNCQCNLALSDAGRRWPASFALALFVSAVCRRRNRKTPTL
jgi:photosystem II stability/assembly factor-like uncharacterized protein